MNPSLIRKAACAIAALGLFAMTAGQAMAADKSLTVKPESEPLKVSFKPVKDSFKPGEPVRFKFKANKLVYLYLFSIDQKSNKGLVILPNKLQQYHKYEPGKEYVVPEKKVEFVADKAGKEKIVMLASTAKLGLNGKAYSAKASFMQADAATVEREVKALVVQAEKKKTEQLVSEVSVDIKAAEKPAAAAKPAPKKAEKVMAFISSDSMEYKLGQVAKVTFGADKPGFVYLLYAGPDGKMIVLKKAAVDGKQFKQVKLKAEKPAGSHALVAVYNAKGDLDPKTIKLPEAKDKEAAKGLSLIKEVEHPMAVYRVIIAE